MSTQHRDKELWNTKLSRVIARSQQDRGTVFNNIGYIISLEMLRECHRALDGSKAVGIDRITKDKYGENLEQNLTQLLLSIRKGTYEPKVSRIVEIPKDDGSTRPLAISCHDDKIVQEAVRRIVEGIFEPLFLNCSHGFRPTRGCDSALIALNKNLMGADCGAVLEIDLTKYFNTIPHEPLIRMLEVKISDRRFLNLIIKLLKAPIRNKEGIVERSEIGSPQGSILSPVIANIYLHYTLDLWFNWINEGKFGGSAGLIRYADDAVFTFRNVKQAEKFKAILVERLAEFGITLNERKTKTLPSGQVEAKKFEQRGVAMPTFTFLGLIHVWGKSINRKSQKEFWRIKRRTCPIRFKKKLKEMKEFIRSNRHKDTLIDRIKSKVNGHLNYFAMNDNMKRASLFVHEVKKFLFKYLNRRSQKPSFNWIQFSSFLVRINFPKVCIRKKLFYDMRLPLD
jgi:group II intron reverse transcriptase/maturase